VLVYEKLLPGDGIVQELKRRNLEPVLPFGPDSCLLRTRPLDEDALIDLAAGFAAIVGASGARITERVLRSLPELQLVSKIGIGHDVIDLAAATNLGVQVTNTPSTVEIDAVAEHAVTLMLAAAKELNFYDRRRMADGGWLDYTRPPRTLRGKTVGLIGFGRIARAVVARLSGWQTTILATDSRPVVVGEGVRMVELDELLALSDFVSLHVSTSAGDPPILGSAELARIKPGVVLVNTARGVNLDQVALVRELRSGRVAVAALDVFHPEPPPADDPLLALPNVLVTPHLGAAPVEASRDMEIMAAEHVRQVLDGETPAALLNPAARFRRPHTADRRKTAP
jgi:phosphoglycerate dehydrogenase-like enzyme